MHSYNGYRTCYYRTFICGEPNNHQIDAYEKASKWISASIDMIRPGVTPDEVAQVWPDATEFGYRDEAEIGRAHVCTPVTNAPLVCRILLEKKTTMNYTQNN